MEPVCVDDLELLAKQRLPKQAYDYYASGADDMLTLADNVAAFSRIKLRPRVLVDVSTLDISTKLLGSNVASPIAVAPTAFQKMAHADGELATARACAKTGTPMILSSWATTSLEDVASEQQQSQSQPLLSASPPRWFQLYVYRDREVTRRLVERAERSGYTALAVTADTPILGRRRADVRNGFALPSHLNLANFVGDSKNRGATRPEDIKQAAKHESGLASYVAGMIDRTLSWKDIEWLKSITKLPIVLKGILTAEDTIKAIEIGAAGVIVSNHGARQLDTVQATIDALPEVTKAANGRIEVYLDGGVRRGTDVLKAIALGAKAVFIGRPVLWGLAYKGEEGVTMALKMLNDELRLAMALVGCTSVSQINDRIIVQNAVSRL